MTNFHGEWKSKSFFEGWYLKHQQADGGTLAVIPAYHLDEKGRASTSVQIITGEGSHFLTYPADDFRVHPTAFRVRVGDNSFSEHGVTLNLRGDGAALRGKLVYGPLTPLRGDIMGPFRFVPGMQCNHGVVSLAHTLTGRLTLNGKEMDFTGGVGYIEKDWGSSFPSPYLWTQCSWRDHGDCAVMASVADIPTPWGSFTGCIAVAYYGGVEYRLATYRGVKVCRISPDELILLQGGLQLHIKLLEERGQTLRAPSLGSMSRTIRESASCRVSYRFTVDGRELFDHTSDNAGYERDGGDAG